MKLTMKLARLLIVTLLFGAAPAFAADVDGKWSGNLSTPNGDVTIIFSLKADGAKLTGTQAMLDSVQPIQEGSIDGNEIVFATVVDFGGMALDLVYTGIVSPTEIKFTLEVVGMQFEFVAKKLP